MAVTLLRGNAYGAYSWAEAVIYPVTQLEQPHVMTLTVVHWIPEDSMCAITLPLIAPTRAYPKPGWTRSARRDVFWRFAQ